MSVGVKNYNYGLVHKEPNFKRGCCFLFATKEDARNALDFLKSRIEREGRVSVYDLYLMIGAKTSTEDDFIGWENIDSACIKPTYDKREFRLFLPKLDYDDTDEPY